MAEPDIPEGAVLDPACEQVLADINVWWVILEDGTRTAWNANRHGPALSCPVCRGGDTQAGCSECQGRGVVLHVPFAPRPWDEVVPGLWLGGHDCQPAGAPPFGSCMPGSEFDMVVSLFNRYGFDPDPHVVHLRHRMADADLDNDHHGPLDVLASHIEGAVRNGDKVLVRCQAGINRAALVVGLALIKMGWKADDAIGRMREVRSPYVLFNQSFVDHLRSVTE